MSRVLFVGSRGLSYQFAPLVFRVVAAVRASGRSAAVGCASGADSFALQACLSLSVPVEVFAVGSRGGSGFWRRSAPLALLRAAPAVHWLAGGPLSASLCRRLAARSRAALGSVPVVSGSGVIAFLSQAQSRGSLQSLRGAARRSLPVVVFCCGFSPSLLPSLGGGQWVPAGSGFWAQACRWQPA